MPVGTGTGNTYMCSGNISPARFVKWDGVANVIQIIQCTGGGAEKIIGIAPQWTHNAPYPLLDDGFAGIAGIDLRVYGPNEVCLVQCGTTAFNPGDYLFPDGSGRAIPATSDGTIYGAQAIEAGPGDGITYVRVMVLFGFLGQAVTP